MDDVMDVTLSTQELGKTAGKDEKSNKITYVKLIGLEKSKLEAKRCILEAKESLKDFGERAIQLLNIADYIISKNN